MVKYSNKDMRRNSKGDLHCEKGPARIDYFTPSKETIRCVSWWYNGKRHRAGGPAVIHYHASGIVTGTHWFHKGEKIKGPADMLERLDDLEEKKQLILEWL